MTELTQDIVEKIAETTSRTYEQLHQKKLKKEHDQKMCDTRKLLRLYPILKSNTELHPENYIKNDEYEKRVHVKIEDHKLVKGNIKTRTLMAFVDRSLSAYENYCMSGDEFEQRRWMIIYDTYLAKKRLKTKEMTQKWHVDQSTISRERGVAVEALSAMTFGIDGLTELLDMYPD